MELETDRLILREYTMDDFDALYEILSDEETMKHYPKPFDEEKVRYWINWNILIMRHLVLVFGLLY